jgi:hypothetical protein
LVLQFHLFHSIVDADSRNVSFNESTFAVTFDETGFPYFSIAYRYDFEGYMLFKREEAFHVGRIEFTVFGLPSWFGLSKGFFSLIGLLRVLPIEVLLCGGLLLKTDDSSDHL